MNAPVTLVEGGGFTKAQRDSIESAIRSLRYGAHPHRSPHADDLEEMLAASKSPAPSVKAINDVAHLRREAEVAKLAEKIRVNAEGAMANINNRDHVYNSIEMIAEDALRLLGADMDFDKPVPSGETLAEAQKP